MDSGTFSKSTAIDRSVWDRLGAVEVVMLVLWKRNQILAQVDKNVSSTSYHT